MDSKTTTAHLILEEARRLLISCNCLLNKGLITTLRSDTFFVQHGKKTGLGFNESQNIGVVIIGDLVKRNTFSLVFFLHRAENIFGKLGLQLFVTVVDTELFVSVANERLESENIKHTNNTETGHCSGLVIQLSSSCVIDASNKPQECTSIDLLGEGFSGFSRLVCVQWDLVCFVSGLHGSLCQGSLQTCLRDAHEFAQVSKFLLRRNLRFVVIRRIGFVGKVTKLQNHNNSLHQSHQTFTCDSNFFKNANCVDEMVGILHALDRISISLSNESERFVVCASKLAPVFGLVLGGNNLVEDVECTFGGFVRSDTVLFE
mmetsp:Transcript_7353/g.15223  ORF Transcript_7353/g.15223 Transcript_7353/m.15223 type:complete len:317 (+) Transcript_7353:1840-2790(+)